MVSEHEYTDKDFDPAALAALDDPGRHVLLTGDAGTGKTTLLKHWIRTRDDGRTILLAPTGLAAMNVGGETIHRFLHVRPGLSPREMEAQGLKTRDKEKQGSIYRLASTIIIDEVSMCRADLMDGMDRYLRAARGVELPFGGVRLIMTGDLMQLPPVVTRDEARLFHGTAWRSPWAFDSHAIRKLTDKGRLTLVELTEAHRQTDPAFLHALDSARAGTPGPRALALFNTRTGRPDPDAITLTARVKDADSINHRRLDRLPGQAMTYRARTDGDWKGGIEPAPGIIRLKEGVRVMMRTNDPSGLYVNGSRGRVTGFENGMPVIHIEDDDLTLTVTPHTWDVQRNYAWYDKESGRWRIGRERIGSYTQLPLQLGWALTIHKSQGMTLNRVNIDLGDKPLFASGMGYVALSRCRTLDGITLSRRITRSDLKADPTPVAWIRAMRTHGMSTRKTSIA